MMVTQFGGSRRDHRGPRGRSAPAWCNRRRPAVVPSGGVAASAFSALAQAVAANMTGVPIPNLTYDVRSFGSFKAVQPPALAFDSQGQAHQQLLRHRRLERHRRPCELPIITPSSRQVWGAILGGGTALRPFHSSIP